MAFCGKCGSKIDEGAKFCISCGTVIEDSSEQSAQYEQKSEQQNELPANLATLNNTKENTADFDGADIEKNKVMGVLAYILFFIPLLAAKDSPFARFHANQGLLLFIGGILCSILFAIPILGWVIAPILCIAIMVLSVIGIINALNGKAKELPIIGKFKILK